jgi:hypothetical protein
MRRPLFGVVLILLSWAQPAATQDTRLPPFERIIDADFEVRQPVSECTVATAVSGLARRYEFVAGIEYPRAACARVGAEPQKGGELVNLRGLTIGQAIDRLLAMDPRYRLVLRDGVSVIRPLEAWANATNLLNFTTGSFALNDTTIGGALAAITTAMSGDPSHVPTNLGTGTEQGARTVSFRTGAASAGEVLDAMVRAHGAAYWIVREGAVDRDGQSSRMIFFHTFDGSGIGTGIRIKP